VQPNGGSDKGAPAPGGPNNKRLAPFSSQPSPAVSCLCPLNSRVIRDPPRREGPPTASSPGPPRAQLAAVDALVRPARRSCRPPRRAGPSKSSSLRSGGADPLVGGALSCIVRRRARASELAPSMRSTVTARLPANDRSSCSSGVSFRPGASNRPKYSATSLISLDHSLDDVMRPVQQRLFYNHSTGLGTTNKL
jgi:hypothetical protein